MSDTLAVARLTVSKDRPYYASVLWALQPVAVKDFAKNGPGPIGVDQNLRLYYDPEAIEQWKPAEVAAVMVHEIGHVLRNHAKRCGGRDKLGWNVAADMEINDDLKEEGLTLPKDAVYPSSMKFKDGLMAEEYYDLLPRVQMKCAGGAASGNCGSTAHGQGEAHESPAEGDGKTPPGITETEAELIRKKVAEDVVAHVKNRGTVPAWLDRWAKDRLTSKVDWRRLLAAFIRRACGDARGRVDYSYKKPGRRQSATPDFVVPSMTQPTPHVAVVVDTSGSMSAVELGQALAEIAAVLEASGQRHVTVLSVDAAVHTTQKVFKASDVKLVGGGGTDMSLGIRAADDLKPRPDVIVLCTDCETGWPSSPTRAKLIVAKTSPGGSPVPSWAKVVEVFDTKNDA